MPTGFHVFSRSVKVAVWIALIIVLAMSAKPALAVSDTSAAIHCSRLGYTLDDEDCVFPDGTRCGMTAFYRGECGAQWSFCEQHGGRLESREERRGSRRYRYAVCVFENRSECGEEAYAEKRCGPSECFDWGYTGCSSRSTGSSSRVTSSDGPTNKGTRHLCSVMKRGQSNLIREVLRPGDRLTVDVCKADWLQCDWDDQAEISDPGVVRQSMHKDLKKKKWALRPNPEERFKFDLVASGNARIDFECKGDDGEVKHTLVVAVTTDPDAAQSVVGGEAGIRVADPSAKEVALTPSSVLSGYTLECEDYENGDHTTEEIHHSLYDEFAFALCAPEWLGCDWSDHAEISDDNLFKQYNHKYVEKPKFGKNPSERYWFQTYQEGSADLTFSCVGESGETVRTHHVTVIVGDEKWARVMPPLKEQQNGSEDAIGDGSWHKVSGRLKQVSVGADGTVWGIGRSDEIYRYSADGQWEEIPGALRQIAVGGADQVWGVNAIDKVYRWSGDAWQQIPGSLKHVSVGADGTVWGVNRNNEVYRYAANGQREKMPGALKQIAVVGRGKAAGDNANKEYSVDGQWERMPGTLKQVDVGGRGVIWGIGVDDVAYYLQKNAWQPVPGAFRQVSVGADGTVLGVSRDDQIHWYSKRGEWKKRPGALKQIDVGKRGEVWGVNDHNEIYRWQRGEQQDPPQDERPFITDVVVEKWSGPAPAGYVPLAWDAATLPGNALPAADVTVTDGDAAIFVKYETLKPTSDRRVLTDVLVQHWPYWAGPYEGGAFCPPGWEQAGGSMSPSGALTRGTYDSCYRLGLCVRKEPLSKIVATPTASAMTNLGLSSNRFGETKLSCPDEADAGGETAFLARSTADILDGCGWPGMIYPFVRVCGYSPKVDPPEMNLHLLAWEYRPRWRFYPGEDQYPMDLDTHLTDDAQFARDWYILGESQGRSKYFVRRVCDKEGWRLVYDWENPSILGVDGGDKVGRRFGTFNGGKAYAFVTETPKGYDIHYFLYYVYNTAHWAITEYDHWGDWERATVHLEWVDEALKPTRLTTEAHGNPWSVGWDSGEVWREGGGNHPDVFVAQQSHGTYPNTSHERDLFDKPLEDSTNRTCDESTRVSFLLHWACDYIAGDGSSAMLPVYTILVDGLFGEPGGIAFIALDELGKERAEQPKWLQTDYSCTPGAEAGVDGPIYWWGNASHHGGPRTPLVKEIMPWHR